MKREIYEQIIELIESDNDFGEAYYDVSRDVITYEFHYFDDDIIELPYLSTGEAYQIMLDFIETRVDVDLEYTFHKAINGKGAFKRFNNLLREYDYENEFYQYKNNRIRDIVDNWLEMCDIELDETIRFDLQNWNSYFKGNDKFLGINHANKGVISINCFGGNQIVADYNGDQTYRLYIETKKDNSIKEMHCSCGKSDCAHLAAFFYQNQLKGFAMSKNIGAFNAIDINSQNIMEQIKNSSWSELKNAFDDILNNYKLEDSRRYKIVSALLNQTVKEFYKCDKKEEIFDYLCELIYDAVDYDYAPLVLRVFIDQINDVVLMEKKSKFIEDLKQIYEFTYRNNLLRVLTSSTDQLLLEV